MDNSILLEDPTHDSLEWLDLPKIPDEVFNPLLYYDSNDSPEEYMIKVLMDKNYLHFAAKFLLNVELLPFQCVILDTLWTKSFPILIASRGSSKSYSLAVYCLLRMILVPGTKIVITGNGLRQARQVFEYMATIWRDSPILKDITGKGKNCGPRREIDRYTFEIGTSVCWAIPLGNGDTIRGLRATVVISDEFHCLGKGTLVETDKGIMRIEDCEKLDFNLFTGEENVKEKPTEFIKTPLTDVYKVTTRNGFVFKCSNIHKVMTLKGWKLGKDLTNRDHIICDNNYIFPQDNISYADLEVNENLAWLMGILTSEGSVSGPDQFQVHMTDKTCIDKIAKSFALVSKNNPSFHQTEPYVDNRYGWDCKEVFSISLYDRALREKMVKLGLERAVAINKKIPHSVLQSPKSVMVSFLSGLFEGDGSCFNYQVERHEKMMGIAYYSVSETLCREVQFLLLKLDISSSIQSRKSKISDKPQWMVRANGQDAKKLFNLLKIEKWNGKSNDCYFHEKKNFSAYFDKGKNTWKSLVYRNGQSNSFGSFKTKEEALENAKNNVNRFKNTMRVKSVEKLEEKEHLYDFYLPDTHCFYGNGFKQHNSVSPEVFNVVVQGFAITDARPNIKVKEEMRIDAMKKMGIWTPELQIAKEMVNQSNQIIRAGTAYYSFNHFYKTYSDWKAIIRSRGDPKKLKEIFGEESLVQKTGFRWDQYAILQIPYNKLPKGFLDPGVLAQAKASLTEGQFKMEFSARFSTDSDGFYKRSTIEFATTNKPISINGKLVQFSAIDKGRKDARYVMGIDPAADADNAAIVILELHEDHRRVVHCWTTNRKKYNKLKTHLLLNENVELEDNYYAYIARKIRSLMSDFQIDRIMMDKFGGGVAIAEALSSKSLTRQGEYVILQIVDPKEPKDDDYKEGIHILELVIPTNDLNAEANHGMLKDIQQKQLLFPMFDTVEVAKRTILPEGDETIVDTYEDLAQEIEELKNELSSIVVSGSSNLGKETFDTPNIKTGNIKGRLRKDRFSALLYANYYCRNKDKMVDTTLQYRAVGGSTTSQMVNSGDFRGMYYGNGMMKFKENKWNQMGPRYLKKN